MTLVYIAPVAPASALAHVLVIGAGHYPNSTISRNARNWSDQVGVNSVTSPPESARAFAGWFLTRFHNPAVPLGSVELLISEEGGAVFDHPHPKTPIGPADWGGIGAAFAAWEARCNAHPGNLAIFYFCGHGAEGANRILIPSDFPLMLPNLTPDWSRVVQFPITLQGMATNQATHQFYFLDCCRASIPVGLAGVSLGTPLCFPNPELPINVRAQFVYGVPPKRSAFGTRGQVTTATDLFIRSLSGAGAEPVRGGWQVTGTRLLRGCREIARVFPEGRPGDQGYPQLVLDPAGSLGDDPVLHCFSAGTLPRVPVRIGCKPEDAAFGAAYSATHLNGTIPLPAPLALVKHPSYHYGSGDLTAGQHEFAVQFVGQGPPLPPTKRVTIEPPVWEEDYDALALRWYLR